MSRSLDARYFFRVACQRFDEAQFLLKHGFTTAAVYLAGYGVECGLKALILSVVPSSRSSEIKRSFKGQKAHDIEALKATFVKYSGTRLPPAISTQLMRTRTWSTDLRYSPGLTPMSEAQEYVRATEEILLWVKGRL